VQIDWPPRSLRLLPVRRSAAADPAPCSASRMILRDPGGAGLGSRREILW
jgi:hypothetical protein